MSTLYVHRRADGKIASTHEEPQPGYAEEALTEVSSTELKAFMDKARKIVPTEVPAGGFIVALKRLKKKAAVDAAVAQADDESQTLYARATHFRRYDARVLAIARAIGMTDDELDDLFILADSI